MYSLVLVQECVIVTAVSCDPLLSRVILHCRYTAGDHIAIYPENDVELVDRIVELLEVNLDQVFSLVNKDGVLCVCVAMCMCSVQAYVCVCVCTCTCVCVCFTFLCCLHVHSPHRSSHKEASISLPHDISSCYSSLCRHHQFNVLKELSEYCSSKKDKQHLNNITAPTDEGKVCPVQ